MTSEGHAPIPPPKKTEDAPRDGRSVRFRLDRVRLANTGENAYQRSRIASFVLLVLTIA